MSRNPNTVANNEQDADHDEQPSARHRQEACAQDAPGRQYPADYTRHPVTLLCRMHRVYPKREQRHGETARGDPERLGESQLSIVVVD